MVDVLDAGAGQVAADAMGNLVRMHDHLRFLSRRYTGTKQRARDQAGKPCLIHAGYVNWQGKVVHLDLAAQEGMRLRLSKNQLKQTARVR